MRGRSRVARGALRGLTVACGLAVIVVGSGVTAANSVPASRVGQSVTTTTANALRPAACSGVSVSTKVTGTGTFSGTSAANLVAASAAADTITALGGNDCILGGAGDDSIDGGAGTDVCIGGPGIDTFANCETQTQ